MKKNFLRFLGMFVLCLCIASCSKSNGDLIKEYGKICDEIGVAYQKGDMDKVSSLVEKGEKIEKELSERDLTDNEEAEVVAIATRLADTISEDFMNQLNAFMDDAPDSWYGGDDDDDEEFPF